MIAPIGTRPGRERPEKAIARAAIRDPTPVAVIRNPKPVASVWRTSSASAGIVTPKFMPNVDTTATVTATSRTSSVWRT